MTIKKVFMIMYEKINTDHLEYLTDDFGIWQHTSGHFIDTQHGYALDDSARALIYTNFINNNDLSLIYLSYLKESIKINRIVNFFDKDKNPLPLPWSEDALGESAWAVSTCIAKGFLLETSLELVAIMNKKIDNFKELRGSSYALIATTTYDKSRARKLAAKIVSICKLNFKTNWHWPENYLSYANAIVPHALIEYGKKHHDLESLEYGLRLLDFLNRVCKKNGIPITIGNTGWFYRGKSKSLFDQQPIDAAYHVLANLAAYETTKNDGYLKEANVFFSWFWGNNLIKKSIINTEISCCYDGIWHDGISPNCGAESIVCYLLAQEKIAKYLE